MNLLTPTRLLALLLLSLTSLSMACRVSEVKTPSGFAALSDDQIEWRSYQWKAVSPDGASILVRERENEEEASLKFWAEALEREIIAQQGYKLIDTAPIAGKNIKGVQMNFEALYGGQPYRYSVALFVNEDDIVTVETAGSQEVWERHEAALHASVQSTAVK